MVKKYGQDVVDELMAKQHDTKKWTEDEVKELRKYFNQKIKDIERGVADYGTGYEQITTNPFE